MYGFPISANQFQVLQTEQQAASSRSTEQKEEGLIDPRTTRQRRWAAQGTEGKEAKAEHTLYIIEQHREILLVTI